MTTHYELGARFKFPANITAELAWKDTKSVEGIKMFARDNRTGEYVQVLENAPDLYVDSEVQSYTVGNFASMENAQKFGAMAYRFINK